MILTEEIEKTVYENYRIILYIYVDTTTGFMNNFNHELLMFFKTLVDGSKYICIRTKSLNRDDAQEYCSENYENGTLCSFETNDEWEDLSYTTRGDPNNYWTGLKITKKNGMWYYEFSDGTRTDFAKTQACKGFKAQWQCQDDQCRCFYLQGGNFRCRSCTDSISFICKVNEGNKIYR
jgi:hypothetical protein